MANTTYELYVTRDLGHTTTEDGMVWKTVPSQQAFTNFLTYTLPKLGNPGRRVSSVRYRQLGTTKWYVKIY